MRRLRTLWRANRLDLDARRLVRCLERQTGPEDRSRAVITIMKADRAAHGLGQMLADRKPQTRAFKAPRTRHVDLAEACKDPTPRCSRNAHAAVDHLDQHPLAGCCQRQLDPAAFGELDGIAKQVGEDLANPQRIADEIAAGLGRQRHRQCQPLLPRLKGKQAPDRIDELAHRERFAGEVEMSGFNFRQIEDVIDDRHHRLARAHDVDREVVLRVIERRLEQQLRHPDHAVERRADFMRDIGQKAAFFAVGGFRDFARRGQLGGHRAVALEGLEKQAQQPERACGNQAARCQPLLAIVGRDREDHLFGPGRDTTDAELGQGLPGIDASLSVDWRDASVHAGVGRARFKLRAAPDDRTECRTGVRISRHDLAAQAHDRNDVVFAGRQAL